MTKIVTFSRSAGNSGTLCDALGFPHRVHRAPDLGCEDARAQRDAKQREDEREIIERARRRDRRIGRRDTENAVRSASQRRPFDEHHADDLAQHERHQHEILAGQPQHDRPDQQRERRSRRGAGSEPDRERPLQVHHQQNADIGADSHETCMCEGDMPGPDNKVQAHSADGVERHERTHREQKCVVDQERPTECHRHAAGD